MGTRIDCKQKEVTVYLDGEIDHHSAGLIRVSIDDIVLNRRPSVLTLDFEKVTFMDSSGIGLVMGRYKIMKSVGGSIRVINLSPTAYRVMKLAGLERLGKICQKEVI